MSSQQTATLSQNDTDVAGDFTRKVQAFITEEAHTLIRIEAAKLQCSNSVVIDMLAKRYLKHDSVPALGTPDAA